jgi:hypothetical protein
MPPNTAPAYQALSSRSSASRLLLNGVSRLEVTLKLTTAILALAAGVYTYLGVRELLNGHDRDLAVFVGHIFSSLIVSAGGALQVQRPVRDPGLTCTCGSVPI